MAVIILVILELRLFMKSRLSSISEKEVHEKNLAASRATEDLNYFRSVIFQVLFIASIIRMLNV